LGILGKGLFIVLAFEMYYYGIAFLEAFGYPSIQSVVLTIGECGSGFGCLELGVWMKRERIQRSDG
jgi:hypothetical protein